MPKCRLTFEDGPDGRIQITGEADPAFDTATPVGQLTPSQAVFAEITRRLETMNTEQTETKPNE